MNRWPLKTIDEVCVVNPRLHRGHGLLDDSAVSFVPMAAVDEVSGAIADSQVRSYAEVKKGYTHFMDNDVLFAKITPCMENGKAAIANNLVGGFGFGSTEFHVLRSKGEVLPDWLFYFVRQSRFRAEAKRNFTGTAGQQRVPTTFLAATKIPVASIAEQRRIVDILSRAEGIVRLRREAESKAAELIPALFLDMFGDPTTNPKGWPMVAFGNVGECRLGKMLDKQKQSGNFQFPYLRNANVQWNRIDTYDLLTMDFHPEEQAKFRLLTGDILICEGGEVGRAAIWNGQMDECYYQKALHRLRPNLEMSRPDFIVWLLWHLAKTGALLGASTHATIAHLTGVQLKSMKVICPPITLQRQFEKHAEHCKSIQSQQAVATATAQSTFDALLSQVFDI